MANHSYTRAVWNSGSVLTAADLADLDDKSTHSIDDRGGVYALTENLEIGGAPGTIVFITNELMTHTGVQSTFKGPVFFNADVTIGNGPDYLLVNSFTDFARDVGFNSGVVFHANVIIGDGPGTTLEVKAGTDFRAVTYFWDDVVFTDGKSVALNGRVTIGDSPGSDFFTVNSRASFLSTVSLHTGATVGDTGDDTFRVKATSDFQSPITFSGDGRMIENHEIGVDRNATYTPRQVRYVHLPQGSLTRNVEYAISDGGAVDGDRITFMSLASYDVTIKRADGSILIAMGSLGTGAIKSVTVRRLNGEWGWDEDIMFRNG